MNIHRFTALIVTALFMFSKANAQKSTIELRFVATTDVHGSFFPYDYINRKPILGSMARVATYVKQLRNSVGDRLVLLDNGDILQGQPACYYYNFVAPEYTNIAASVLNKLKYDVQTPGNHDIETGHAVYDKWAKELHAPLICANVVNVKTGKPYFKPYMVMNRQGVKIAVLGLLTPAIPNWLPMELWSGMTFEDMVSSARKWVKIIQQKEKPDVLIGLFHSGKAGGITTPQYTEDASLDVAELVPGFDVVFFGHDHTRWSDFVTNVEGKQVLCLNPANNAQFVADAKLTLTLTKGKVTDRRIEGNNQSVKSLEVDEEYMQHFAKDIARIDGFVSRKIGENAQTMSTRDCFFGNSAFTDYIHEMLLEQTGADISFNAPLAFDAQIAEGAVHVSDLFNLYKYENQIYVLRMRGSEIRKHLEYSYDHWVNTMKSADDHIMLLNAGSRNDNQRFGFKNLTFNFDSACGIDYVVDVTQPDGLKVKILGMSDGTPFDEQKWYKVAMSSYRGNGGGELLTKGAGISVDELGERVVFKSEKDQRFYLMQKIEKTGKLDAKPHANWRFVPEEWTREALKRDRKIIFNE